jgi:hypothetical protein
MSNPVVGILMGSDSDWEVMQQAAKQLESFGWRMKRGFCRRIARLMLRWSIRPPQLLEVALYYRWRRRCGAPGWCARSEDDDCLCWRTNAQSASPRARLAVVDRANAARCRSRPLP